MDVINMKRIVIFGIFNTFFCYSFSFAQNEKNYADVLETVFDSFYVKTALKSYDEDAKKHVFLKNKFLTNFQYDSIEILEEKEILNKEIENFFFIYDIILDEKLGRILITSKSDIGIIIYIDKKNKKWSVSNVSNKRGYQLSKSNATDLYNKISYHKRKKDDINIFKLKKGMSMRDVDSIMIKKLWNMDHYKVFEYRTPLYEESFKIIYDNRNDKIVDIIKAKTIRKGFE